MLIELTEAQCAELQRLLENALDGLSRDIADGDDAGSREELRARREVIESVLFLLDNPPRTNA